MPERSHEKETVFPNAERWTALRKAEAARTVEPKELRVPVQAGPVDRLQLLPPFMLDYSSDPSFHLWVIPEADPNPDPHGPFTGDPRMGICPVLSSYAVAACFRKGGLF